MPCPRSWRHKGLSFICDCYQDPWIRSCITGAFNEAHDAVLQEYAFDSAEDAEWVEFIMAKLDAGVKDPIDRVMAGADEKLSRENRFVGPALMCLEHGIVPFYLARGIAYGLAYLAGERDVDVKDPAQLRALMADVCGLTEEDACSPSLSPSTCATSRRAAPKCLIPNRLKSRKRTS